MDRAPTAEQLVNFPVNENPRPSLTIGKRSGPETRQVGLAGLVVHGLVLPFLPSVVTTGAGGRQDRGMDRAPTAEQLVNFPVSAPPRPSLTTRKVGLAGLVVVHGLVLLFLPL